MKKLLITAIALGLMGNAQAGFPVQDKMTCPLGGKSFEVTSTASCSSMGVYMNLQSVTSCDFVTRLPQCPDNGLWVYKDFSDDELELLPAILDSENYKLAGSMSRYYQAYLIEQALPEPDMVTSFFLLQQGIWYDPIEETLDDPKFYAAYEATLTPALDDEELESAEFYEAAQIMYMIHHGALEEANYKYKAIIVEDKSDNEYYKSYLNALNYCLDNPSDENLCSLHSPLRAHEDKEKK